MLKVFVFYLVRWLGSVNHPIKAYKASVAAVHMALVPLACLAFLSYPKTPPVRYGAETDRWGNERVGISPVKAWLANEEEGRDLVKKCDALYEKLKKEEVRGPVSETASERM
jgi:3-keto steroid reductase